MYRTRRQPKPAAPKTFVCATFVTFEAGWFVNLGPYPIVSVSITSPRTGAVLTARCADLPASILRKAQEATFAIGENVSECDASGMYDQDDCGERQAAYESIAHPHIAFTTDELRAFARVARRAA